MTRAENDDFPSVGLIVRSTTGEPDQTAEDITGASGGDITRRPSMAFGERTGSMVAAGVSGVDQRARLVGRRGESCRRDAKMTGINDNLEGLRVISDGLLGELAPVR